MRRKQEEPSERNGLSAWDMIFIGAMFAIMLFALTGETAVIQDRIDELSEELRTSQEKVEVA